MKKILITAGPTHEYIDPVRFLGNASSGKMGIALVKTAVEMGYSPILILGPTHIEVPENIETIHTVSANEMYNAVKENISACEVAIFSAAVSDFMPIRPEFNKIKKRGDTIEFTLKLKRTPSILGSARRKFGFEGILVGFAAETEDLEKNAITKLEKNDCDLLFANHITKDNPVFFTDKNEGIMLCKNGEKSKIEKTTKDEIASLIIQASENLILAKKG